MMGQLLFPHWSSVVLTAQGDDIRPERTEPLWDIPIGSLKGVSTAYAQQTGSPRAQASRVPWFPRDTDCHYFLHVTDSLQECSMPLNSRSSITDHDHHFQVPADQEFHEAVDEDRKFNKLLLCTSFSPSPSPSPSHTLHLPPPTTKPTF